MMSREKANRLYTESRGGRWMGRALFSIPQRGEQ